MTWFSQRNGYAQIPAGMIPEQITSDLRNTLWNVIDASIGPSAYNRFTHTLWTDFYKWPVDDRPSTAAYQGRKYRESWIVFRKDYLSCVWYRVYDYIEFLIQKDYVLEKDVNKVLKAENAAYRAIGGKISQITDSLEITEVEEALAQSNIFFPISHHIETALVRMSDRNNPDFRNSIKESISAVESMAKIVTGDEKATLNKVLAKLQSTGKINPALENGFKSIYNWTSDQQGIRHALMDKADLNHADAKFFLIACSAFCNYLKTFAD